VVVQSPTLYGEVSRNDEANSPKGPTIRSLPNCLYWSLSVSCTSTLSLSKLHIIISYGAVHKGRLQSGGFVQCGHFSDKGGSSDANVRTFWRKKHRFFEIYGVCTDKGVEPVRTRVVNFSRFCADVFYGRSLTAQTKQNHIVFF